MYSSANGKVYSPSFTDLASGDAYGRSGIAAPKSGTGDGGKGGAGGEAGVGYIKTVKYTPSGADPSVVNEKTYLVVIKQGGPGKPGTKGADGVCVIYWDKEASA